MIWAHGFQVGPIAATSKWKQTLCARLGGAAGLRKTRNPAQPGSMPTSREQTYLEQIPATPPAKSMLTVCGPLGSRPIWSKSLPSPVRKTR